MMEIIHESDCICCFASPGGNEALYKTKLPAEVYYGSVADMPADIDLRKLISNDEWIRSGKFLMDDSRETFLWSHAILRTVLSHRLGIIPTEITVLTDANKKPYIEGGALKFNITHSKNSFAVAFTNQDYVGVDLERHVRGFDFKPVMNSFFSEREKEFILNSGDDPERLFFLLWTRKEALLKALGIGIVTDLRRVEVCGSENLTPPDIFKDALIPVNTANYIYSVRVSEYFLSIALPEKSDIKVINLNSKNIYSYL